MIVLVRRGEIVVAKKLSKIVAVIGANECFRSVEDMKITIFTLKEIVHRAKKKIDIIQNNKNNIMWFISWVEKGRDFIPKKLNIWISPINHNKSSRIFFNVVH